MNPFVNMGDNYPTYDKNCLIYCVMREKGFNSYLGEVQILNIQRESVFNGHFADLSATNLCEWNFKLQ